MILDLDRLEPSRGERSGLVTLAVLGAAAAAAGAAMNPDRLWASWLLVGYYSLGLALSGLCLVAIHYTTGASWSVVVRRTAEAMASTLPLGVLLLAVAFLMRPRLYSWTEGLGALAGDPAAVFKRAWLSRSFFLVRAATYVVLWGGFAAAITRRSRRQDADSALRWTKANVRLSAAFLPVFGVTFTLASIDWIMSLEPSWYSTIFAFYNFAGLLQSGLAVLILVTFWMEGRGPLRGVLNAEHRHDLGKLLFALSSFWMYLWFSQYLLIWYANVPEETAYFVRRAQGGWLALQLANVLLNWVVPFVALLSREAKRRRSTLAAIAATVLVGRWLDLYLMIFPSVVGDSPRLAFWEVGTTAGALGCFVLMLVWILRQAPTIPIGDPQLDESLRYEQ